MLSGVHTTENWTGNITNNSSMALFRVFGRKRHYDVYGRQGGISTSVTLPEGFDKDRDRCPMVILMHGFMSSKNIYPVPQLAKALAAQGIASIRFDFNAHGSSEGNFIDMTISNEIEDAKAVFDYVCSLPYVSSIGFAGHSQGGVIAGMLAGELENAPVRPACVALLAPAAVLKDDALAGQCMGAKYDASDPPEYVKVMFHKLGRAFILEAQKLQIYEISSRYTGNVCILHGKKDRIVPYSYSVKYDEVYSNSELHLIEDEGHFMKRHRTEVTGTLVAFMKKSLL